MIKFYAAKIKILFIAGVMLLTASKKAGSQQPAFPGAEGAGMYTSGGRGTTGTPTTVFEVTNLNDDGLVGSLRYALTAAATYRTVVFRVSGTIHLNSKLTIRANTTIAGQTAPGDGIAIADYPTVISGDNVIVRYMRFRMGDKNQNKGKVNGSGGDDAFGSLGSNNLIIDHCSVSWSDDEALTIYRGDNLTIQWCFITEPLNYSYHFETGDVDYEQHGYGGIWGAKRGSMHHNLIADARNRNPRFAGISTYSPNTVGVENVDLRNNVIYNWGINTVYGGEGGNYNVVNNFYKYGPNTGSGVRYRIANPSFTTTIPYGKWYINGNYVDGSSANTANNWSGVVMQSNVAADTSLSKVTTPFDIGYPLTTETALEAYESVLQKAGSVLPNRDTLDQRIVNDVRNRTGRIIDVQGGYPHGTPYDQTVNAWPALNSTAAPTDTDHDGMPDSWETANSLNPNDAGDRNVVAANGYTNLENYLNSLATPAVSTTPTIYANAAFTNFSQTIGTPSAAQTFTVSGVNLTAPITITAPVNYELSTDETNWSSSVSLTPVNDTVNSTTISVRLNASAVGAYSGNIVNASTGAYDVNIAVSGTAGQNTQNPAVGVFPDMDGGFENQLAGSYSSVSTHTSTTQWEASAKFNIDSLTARTGLKSLHWNQASTSNKYLFTPVLTANPLQPNAPYVIQFWYRVPGQLVNNTTTPISLYGWATVTGQTGGSNIALTSQLATLNSTTQTGTWIFFSGTLTSPNLTPTTTYAGFKISNPQSPYFDIDDYVVYPGTEVDNTAPDSVTNAVANGSTSANTITLNWTSPATGVDGGGYMVVRSTVSTAPTPNEKGVYVVGNTIGTDYTVVYIGTNTSFTDNDVTGGTTYYYHVFTVDKAFNYATPVSISGSLTSSSPFISVSGTLNNFSQTVGTPSLSQSFTINANGLTGNITVTAPTGFEVSEDDNIWSSSLSLTPVNGSVQSSVLVRLNAAAAGDYSGSITIAGSGATTITVSVNGTTRNATVIPAGTNAVVAKDGSGDFTSVQAAIDAAPTGRITPYKIFIKKGKYVEPVKIPGNKPFIQLAGESLAETIISYDNYSGKPNPAGGTYGTSTSGTLIINAPDVMLMNLSIENSVAYGKDANAIPPAPGDGPQAVAVYTTSDRVVFYNCRFNGGQDTYYGGNVEGTRSYLKNCYIDGNTDFMFGSSTIIFDTCIIYPRTRLDEGSGGYVTAVNTKDKSGYGYVFRDCKITKNRGATFYSLGRPWQNDAGTADASKSNNKVAFLNTQMGSSINATGWSTWDAGTNTSYITYTEYNSKKYDGTPVDVSNRVSWSKQLTATEAAKYYNNDTVFVNANTPAMTAWDPYAQWPELNSAFTPEISVSNLIAKKGTSTSTITWNLSWPMPDVTCELYRSTDKTNFTLVNSQVSAEDSAGNFSFSENVPPAGQTYYYIVRASKAGFTSITSDTTLVSSTPTITVTGTMGSFLQGLGTPTAAQTYMVSGVNILDNITITPPAGYEVSANGGTNWFNNTTPLVLTPASGSVANTTISVRLNTTSAGTYSGDIVHTSSGAATINMAVTGTVQTEPLPVSEVLEYWPMTQNNQDSAAIRSAGIIATVPTFNNFTVSDGVTVPSVPAYSSQYGQAFGATASGLWGTSSGGPGGNLSRTYYEQFTITASADYSVRVDSILLTTSFYNTSSNTKLAVVYSLSGFASDSTEVPGSTFAGPIALINETSGTTSSKALALNGAAGVSIATGQTLTFRLYYSCGSTSSGRYAKLKDVIVKGLAIAPPSITVTGTLNAFSQTAGTPSAVQTYTITGAHLKDNIVITPPAAYEVSSNGTTWYKSTSPLVLTPTSDSVARTTISIRLNATAAGDYSGDIINAATDADTIKLAVTGTTVSAPAITVTGTLSAFSQTLGNPSAVKTYTVFGANLTDNIVITAPANFELSTDGITWSASPVILTQASGTVATTTISVRLNASAVGNYTGDITHTSAGATTINLAVNGTAVPPPSVTITQSLKQFIQVIGTPSTVQTYTVAGENLTGNVTITPPLRYELSLNGSSWQTTALTLAPTNGSLSTTTISVRLNGIVTGPYNGNIVHATTGLTASNMPVTGLVTIKSEYGVYPIPAYHTVYIAHPIPVRATTITIYTVSGQRLKVVNAQPDTFETPLDVSNLSNGMYMVEVNTGNQKTILRFIKE